MFDRRHCLINYGYFLTDVVTDCTQGKLSLSLKCSLYQLFKGNSFEYLHDKLIISCSQKCEALNAQCISIILSLSPIEFHDRPLLVFHNRRDISSESNKIPLLMNKLWCTTVYLASYSNRVNKYFTVTSEKYAILMNQQQINCILWKYRK